MAKPVIRLNRESVVITLRQVHHRQNLAKLRKWPGGISTVVVTNRVVGNLIQVGFTAKSLAVAAGIGKAKPTIKANILLHRQVPLINDWILVVGGNCVVKLEIACAGTPE